MIYAKTGNDLCPVFWLNIDISEMDESSNDYMFTDVNFVKSLNKCKVSNKLKPLPYTRARKILLSSLNEIGFDSSIYALHSLRSGGVTAAANNNVSVRLLKIHGRWVTDKAKDSYIKTNLEHKILFSMYFGL